MNGSKVGIIVVIVLMAVSYFTLSCGHGHGKSSGGNVFSALLGSDTHSSGERQIRRLSIDDAIAEVEASTAPETGSDYVGPSVYDAARGELVRAMETMKAAGIREFPLNREDRRIAIEALGLDGYRDASSGGRDDYIDIPDVYVRPMPDGSNRIEWREVLKGDFDGDGEVGVPDITPIAVNYLHIYGDGVEDERDRFLTECGDGDNEVAIADITTIALNYLSTGVAGYDIWRVPMDGGSPSRLANPGSATLPTTSRLEAAHPGGKPAQYSRTVTQSGSVSSVRRVSVIDDQGKGLANGNYYYVIEPREEEFENTPPVTPSQLAFNVLVIYETPFRLPVGQQIKARVEVYGNVTPQSYSFNWGDGNLGASDSSLKEMVFTHTYSNTGEYAPYVTVTAQSGSDTVIMIQNAPIVTINPDIPFAPTGLSVSPQGNGVHLNWDVVDPQAGDGYNVYWSLRSGESRPEMLNSVPISSNTFDTNITDELVGGASIYFKTTAVRSGLESAFSNEFKWPVLGIEAPQLTLLPTSGDDSVDLSWNSVPDSAVYEVTGYRVFKGTELGDPDALLVSGTDPLPATQTSFTYTPEASEEILYFYAVTVTNVGESGKSNEVSWLKSTMNGKLPVAVANASVEEGYMPLSVDFTVDGSTDPDGVIVEYAWKLFDEDTYQDYTASGGAVSHTYEDEGVYEAVLRVTDNDGLRAYDSVFINVIDPVRLPEITGVNPTSGFEGTTVTFNAVVEGTQPFTYDWDFGGGASPATSSVASPSVTLGAVGQYSAYLHVTNEYGEDFFDFTLTVDGRPAEVTHVSPTTCYKDKPVTFNAVVTGTEPITYSWDFGGGCTPNTSSDASPTVTAGAVGVYDASLTVDNDYGDAVVYPLTIGITDAARGDWWMYGRNATHQRISPFAGPDSPTLKWRYQTGGAVNSSPVLGGDGTVYVGSDDGYLYAITPTGDLQWRYPTENKVISTPAVGTEGTIYFGSTDGGLRAVKPDGKPKWLYELDQPTSSSPAIGADGTIYIGCDYYGFNDIGGELTAINSDGSFKWSFRSSGSVYTSPSINSDGAIYFASCSHWLFSLTPQGDENWRFDLKSPQTWVAYTPVILDNNTICTISYFYGFNNYYGYLYSVKSDGSPNWTYGDGTAVNNSFIVDKDYTYYVFSDDHYVRAITSEGNLWWRYKLPDHVASSPALDNNDIMFFGCNDNNIYAFDPSIQEVKWTYPTGGDVDSSPAIGEDGTIYIGSDDGYLYAIGE